MFKRVLVIGSATALALVVLLITMLAEPAKTTPGAGSTAATPGDAEYGSFEPGAKGVSKDAGLSAKGGVRYTRQSDKGVLTMIGGSNLVQKPQGIAEVDDPWARIFLTPTRVLEIRAERGNFVVPDRQPRSGEFQGRVVITLFDAGGRPVDLSGKHEEDIAMRVFLRDARFDMELNQIDSDGPVHVTSPRVDFKGKGLSLSYSGPNRRVESLKVLTGEQIVLKQNAQAPAAVTKTEREPSPKGATTKPAPAEPQFYRATLDKNVRIHGPTLEVEAVKLVAMFSLDRGGGSETIMKGMGGARAPRVTPASSHEPMLFVPAAADPRFAIAAALVPQFIGQTTQPFNYPLPEDKPMIQLDPANDMVITWTGLMTVEPEEKRPDGLAGADDVRLELIGAPLKVTTFKRDPAAKDSRGAMQELITAQSFNFFTRSGHITLKGSEQFPLVMDSVALGGRLRGPALAVDQEKGVGQIIGAGSLESLVNEPVGGADNTAELRRQAAGRMPSGLKIAWRDQLDLTFTPRVAGDAGDADEEKSDLIRLRGLKHAAFRGGVVIDDPQFKLQSDLLSLGLSEAEKGRATLDTIQASGHVQIQGKGAGEDNKLAVTSEELEVKLERDAKNDPQPTKLIARKNVHAELPHRALDAGLLEVGLGVGQNGDAAVDAAAGITAGRLAVRTINASENVVIKTDDPLTITGQRVIADLPKDEVEIHGTAEKPARVQRPDGALVGEKIAMNQKTQAVRIPGAGQFQFALKNLKPTVPAGRANNSPAPAAPAPAVPAVLAAAAGALPDNLATVDWRDEMTFDNLKGHAHFVGQVKVVGRSGREVTRLRAEDLQLEFMPDPAAAKNGAPATQKANGNGKSNGLPGGPRVLDTMTATKDAHFDVEGWEAEPNSSKLLRRLAVNGPTMTFKQSTQEMKVPGPGSLSLEDDRPEPEGSKAKVDATKVTPDGDPQATPAKFTGRGRTLMKWDEMLTLNMERNDMLVEKNVRMIHEPADKKGDMVLRCKTLLTDMEDSGGMASWMDGKAQPALRLIKADGEVNVEVQGRTIKTDHLQFTEADQIVLLTGDGERDVEMTSPTDPNAFSARAFKWNLKTGGIEIISPSAGHVPVGK